MVIHGYETCNLFLGIGKLAKRKCINQGISDFIHNLQTSESFLQYVHPSKHVVAKSRSN